jgi:hypothetical protein
MKNFLKESFQKVEYLRDIGEDALHDVLYSLQATRYKAGYILQKPNDDIHDLYLL